MGERRVFCVIYFIILSSAFSVVCGYLDYDGWINIELHHSLDHTNPEIFSYRGNVTIPNLNSGLSHTVQLKLSEQQRKSLQITAFQDGFYRMRAIIVYANGSKQTFLASSKSCCLLSAQLNDMLWIAVDGSGFVMAITQTVSSQNAIPCANAKSVSFVQDFNTDILIRHTELAPVPDTASFVQKIEREREARERGEIRDNRGFFAKYWMYIVPVVLLVFISGATNQEAAK